MTALNNRNASNSKTASRVGMPAAGMLAKVIKPATACREDNNNIDTSNMRWQQQQWKVSNIQQGRQQQQQKLKTRNGKSSLF
jgi:hypothetical protein